MVRLSVTAFWVVLIHVSRSVYIYYEISEVPDMNASLFFADASNILPSLSQNIPVYPCIFERKINLEKKDLFFC